MVQNLRRNISKEDRLYIYDTNLSATTKFKHEATAENGEGETVVVADRPHTVAENSVSHLFLTEAAMIFLMILFYL